MKPLKYLRLGMLAIALIPPAAGGSIVSTLPAYSGSFNNTGPFPLAPVTVGTFSDPAVLVSSIIGATIGGTFGNSAYPNSSGVNVYADGVLLASCPQWPANLVPCNSGSSPTAWSFSFPAADFSLLASGNVDLTAVQTSGNIIRLGQTTLNITTVPEPRSWIFALAGLAGLAIYGLLNKRRVSSAA